MIAVVAAGAVICVIRGGEDRWSRPAILALASLGCMVALFGLVVLAGGWRWAVPVLAALSVIVPLVVYAALVSAPRKAQAVAHPVRRSAKEGASSPRRAPASRQVDASWASAAARASSAPTAARASSAAEASARSAERSEHFAESASAPLEVDAGMEGAFKPLFAPEPVAGIACAAAFEPAPVVEAAVSSAGATEVFVPVFRPAGEAPPEAGPAPAIERAFELAPVLEPAPSPALTRVSSPEPAPGPVPAPGPAPAPASEPNRASEPAIKPAPAPAPEPNRAVSFEDCLAKARSLKSKGALAVAARLFRECAVSAPDASLRRAAQFEELACCVKAGQARRARVLCEGLAAERDVLTASERIKLDAVARMM